ncbi:MAG: hypothetical protein NT113_10790 [Hyphomicrobiales bacterium]|nr:hypothetical protein [Hyphomicrobiales bacterium]
MTELRDGLARRDLSKTDKYLLVVAHHDGPVTNSNIKVIAKENGWRDGAQSNPSAFLSKSNSALFLPTGWTLTGPGRSDLERRGIVSQIGVLTPVTHALEKYILDLHDPEKARFVEEAISCVRNKSYRAAIVLTWVGAVCLLYGYVIREKLAEFNKEVYRRYPKSKPSLNVDDIANVLKESEFMNVLEHLGVITKAESKELIGCLDRRNTAGHPNSHTFTEVGVGNHIETLVSNVYLRF